MYHCTGPDGVLSGIWPRCIELHVQEHDTGDALCLAGARYSTFVDPEILDLPGNVERQYLSPEAGGVPFTASAWVARSHPRDELERWNTVDLIVMGNDYAVHVVNGVVNHRLTHLQEKDENGEWIPLEGGRFLFQAELAEVFFQGHQDQTAPHRSVSTRRLGIDRRSRRGFPFVAPRGQDPGPLAPFPTGRA